MASLVGMIVLAALTTAFALLVPDEQVRRPLWLFVFLALAASAAFCWSHKDAPTTPLEWLRWAALSVPVAVVLCLVDGAIALLLNPSATFIEAMESNGMVVLNLAISPFGTFIALAGWARCVASRREECGG